MPAALRAISGNPNDCMSLGLCRPRERQGAALTVVHQCMRLPHGRNVSLTELRILTRLNGWPLAPCKRFTLRLATHRA